MALGLTLRCVNHKKMSSVHSKTKTTQVVKPSFFIDSTAVRRHLYTLASDAMEGRKSGTAGIEKAAKYIENEFKNNELVNEVVNFIAKDKKRPICLPINKN